MSALNESTNGKAFISEELYEKLSAISGKLGKGDILVTGGGSVGKPYIVPNNHPLYTKDADLLWVKANENLDPYFIYIFFFSPGFRDYLSSISHIGTIAHYTITQLGNTPIMLPKVAEQKQIGRFFTNLDNLIALHQRKLKLLKRMKQAYLRQIFPQNDEKVPRLRFANYSGNWEQRKLGEVADIVGGGTPSTSVAEYWNGCIDWYAPAEIGNQIYVNSSIKKISQMGLKKSSAQILPVGAILFTSRAGIGNTAILNKTGCTNQGFQSIVPHKNKLDSYFIFARTNELKRYGEITGAGSTFVEVSGKQMAAMQMMIPTLQEQKQIGAFFCTVDKQIALHQKKLDNLKQIKTAYLKSMFI